MKETTKDDVIARLKTVEDPEMHVDVYSLGLIYDINITAEKIYILMTLTTPFCPYSKQIEESIAHVLGDFNLPVEIETTFEPEWVPPKDLRIALGV